MFSKEKLFKVRQGEISEEFSINVFPKSGKSNFRFIGSWLKKAISQIKQEYRAKLM
jgi:hypothetical protein